MKEKEEEWFCFIQESYFHIIDKQLLRPGLNVAFYMRRIELPN